MIEVIIIIVIIIVVVIYNLNRPIIDKFTPICISNDDITDIDIFNDTFFNFGARINNNSIQDNPIDKINRNRLDGKLYGGTLWEIHNSLFDNI